MSELQEYTCWPVLGASVRPLRVKAETPEEAADQGWDEAETPSLCHQCSKEVELSDISGIIVTNSDVEEVYNDTWDERLSNENAKLKAKVAELEEALELANAR